MFSGLAAGKQQVEADVFISLPSQYEDGPVLDVSQSRIIHFFPDLFRLVLVGGTPLSSRSSNKGGTWEPGMLA